jgi:hypothetical protein
MFESNERNLEDLKIDEIHIMLETLDSNWTDKYYLNNFFLNNRFISNVKKLFDASELTNDEIRKCIMILGFSTRVKENSLVKNNEEIRNMFSNEQIDTFNALKAHEVNLELTKYFNKSNKFRIIK